MHLVRNIGRVLNRGERLLLAIFVIVAIISGIVLLRQLYLHSTTATPKPGGAYTEGIIGEVRSINPILAPVNDADRDLSELVFDGLMRINNEGNITPALAERYAIGDGGKIYDFFLRTNAVWHDGEPVTAEDVIFTINRIKDPEFRSPLRQNWAGVEVEALDDYSVRFTLRTPYAPFLSNTTVGILPRHIWSSIASANFPLAQQNIRAIGAGPYQISRFERNQQGTITSIELDAFENYYEGRPYINRITLRFYPNEEAMIAGLNSGEIDGLSFLSPKNKDLVRGLGNLNLRNLQLPRYFALFFNQSQSTDLSNKNIRTALAHATNKQKIVESILGGDATPIETAIPPGLLGHADDIEPLSFNQDRAKELLTEAGWILGSVLINEKQTKIEDAKENKTNDTEENIPEKENNTLSKETLVPELRYQRDNANEEFPIPLTLKLFTSDWPELITVAQIIADQWQDVGIRVEVEIATISEIQEDIIRPREYQVLLFGEILGIEPDPFSFWHSSQKKDPGINLALYDNRDADKLLEDARQILDNEKRAEKYREFQKLIANDIPAIFLYTPPYLYAPHKSIKGIDTSFIALPSDRFSEVHKWYIETKRRP